MVTRTTAEDRKTFSGRVRFLAAAAVPAIVVVIVVLYVVFWPFTQQRVLQQLSQASDSNVLTQEFHRSYFPPGCTLDDVSFQHEKTGAPLIHIRKLVIRGSYLGLVEHRLKRVVAVGMQISIPAFGSGAKFQSTTSNIVIDELIADDSLLEFQGQEPEAKALRFDIHRADLHTVGFGKTMAFQVAFHNPNPPGEIDASGTIGAWMSGKETPVSGNYTLRDADLGVYHGIAGTLSSTGVFHGTIKHINVGGKTDVPDFEVRKGRHKVHLTTNFDAYVDGDRGDTFLNKVQAHFGSSEVMVQGSIAGAPGRKGKFTDLNLYASNARIEDILALFVKEKHAPMVGATTIKAKAEIPPGPAPFLKKVTLAGTFTIDEGNFTKPQTQTDVNKLSAGARGEKKADAQPVESELSSYVVLKDGTANFTNLTFHVPGVKAHLYGTYSILNYRINLHGPMRVDTKIADTTTGFKAFVLKLINPIFKRRRKGEIVPVHIGGVYDHPTFGIDLDAKPGKKYQRSHS